MTKEEIGLILRSARDDRGWSQREAVQQIRRHTGRGMSPGHVSNVESGLNVSDDYIGMMAETLGYRYIVERRLISLDESGEAAGLAEIVSVAERCTPDERASLLRLMELFLSASPDVRPAMISQAQILASIK